MPDLPLATRGKRDGDGYKVKCWRCHAVLGVLTVDWFADASRRGAAADADSVPPTSPMVPCARCKQVNRVTLDILR